jgi:hypothetical protein
VVKIHAKRVIYSSKIKIKKIEKENKETTGFERIS